MMYYELLEKVIKDSGLSLSQILATPNGTDSIYKYWFYRYERGYSTLVQNVKDQIKEGK
jgi:hypothetical protein